MTTDMIRDDRKKDWERILSRLKTTPYEKLSKAARWMLESEEKQERVDFDMRAVMR